MPGPIALMDRLPACPAPKPFPIAIEIGKGFGAGQAGKRSIKAIGPGMVGASEVPSQAHFSLLRYEPCAAVAADVKKNPQHSIRAAGHQQGRAAKVDREDRTRFS